MKNLLEFSPMFEENPVLLPMTVVLRALARALEFPGNPALRGLPEENRVNALATVYCPSIWLREGALIFTSSKASKYEWLASHWRHGLRMSAPDLSAWSLYDIHVDRVVLTLLALAVGIDPGKGALSVLWHREQTTRDEVVLETRWVLHGENGWLVVTSGRPVTCRDHDRIEIQHEEIARETDSVKALKDTLLYVLGQSSDLGLSTSRGATSPSPDPNPSPVLSGATESTAVIENRRDNEAVEGGAEVFTTAPDGIPPRIAFTLRSVQKAVETDDYRTLATINEHVQPLADAIVRRVRAKNAKITALRAQLYTAAQLVASLQDDVNVQRRAIIEACALLHVTDDSEDDWPKLPTAVSAVLRELNEARAQVKGLQGF